MPGKRYKTHMRNSKSSSYVKTIFISNKWKLFFSSVYCSNEVLSFGPQSQEKTVELVVIHNSPT